ncbi:MAG: hypothetical protein ABIH66_10095 [bacterium]
MNKKFRPNFFQFLLLVKVVALLAFACFLLIAYLMYFDGKIVYWILLVPLVLWFIVAVVMYLRCVVEVTQDGIYGIAPCGKTFAREFFRWEVITAAKDNGEFLSFFWGFMGTHRKEKRPFILYIPICLKKDREFREEIIKFAPEGNPVKEYFQMNR